jgi:hypothetical protein
MALCFERAGGLVAGVRLASFINDWAILEKRKSREITSTEFVQSWSGGRQATAYRRLAMFREAFPEYGEKGTPHSLGFEFPEPVAVRPKVERERRGWRTT